MIKINIGFREDQYVLIENSEAHKAYYLFSNPEARSVFENGTVLIGRNIQSIEPAYNESMGWNPTHKLDADDWNEIRKKGIDIKFRDLFTEAKEISYLAEKDQSILNKPLREARKILLK